MKMLTTTIRTSISAAFIAAITFCAPIAAEDAPRVGVVNFKQCVEESKLGIAEREVFDEMRKTMESALEEKESHLQEMARNFNDPDYVDGLSPEAEAKVKQEYQATTQEFGQLQQQYYQMLNQANFKVIQKLGEEVAAAAKQIGTKQGLSLVLNEESSFYYSDALDISSDVIEVMNKSFESETASAPSSVISSQKKG